MNGKFAIHACLLGGILLTGAATTANADQWNKKTYINTTRSIEVPGAILPPGRYVFKLLESSSNRHIVQILNDRENHVYATNLAFAKQRMQPADDTILTFYEMPGGGPEPVRSWFYPGDTIGQEFAYPRHRALEISRAMHENVPILAGSRENDMRPVETATATPTTTASTETASATSENSADRVVLPAETPESSAVTPAETSSEATAAMPDEQPQATSPPASSTPEPAMPHTSGNTAAIALVGLGCLGIALSLRMAGKAASH